MGQGSAADVEITAAAATAAASAATLGTSLGPCRPGSLEGRFSGRICLDLIVRGSCWALRTRSERELCTGHVFIWVALRSCVPITVQRRFVCHIKTAAGSTIRQYTVHVVDKMLTFVTVSCCIVIGEDRGA